MPKSAKRGRPKAKPGAKISARHSVNYLETENDEVVKAALAEGERFIGRWIGKAALARARAVNGAKP